MRDEPCISRFVFFSISSNVASLKGSFHADLFGPWGREEGRGGGGGGERSVPFFYIFFTLILTLALPVPNKNYL